MPTATTSCVAVVARRSGSRASRCDAALCRSAWRDKFAGVLALTLPEALWLVEGGVRDVVVAYPSLDRAALSALAGGADRERGARVVVMVDDLAHLDAIGSAGATPAAPVRVCVELDAGWWLAGGRIRVGARRSPLHSPGEVVAIAAEVQRRPELELVGLMAYESQIAGVGNAAGGFARARLIRLMQSASASELRRRRAATVAAVQAQNGPLDFVNAGGTGSIERSTAEDAVTEVAAGSGLLAPALFDTYAHFAPQAAAFFALSVVRRPGPGVVTALGGGYVASGAPGDDRLPVAAYPEGLKLDAREGAGEAQTPLLGAAADSLAIGDRVWMRHAKAGELSERFDVLHLIQGDRIVESVPTYRGEGQCFL